MLVWAYHPKLRPVAVAVVAIAVVVAVEAVDKWESYSWCRASPAFAPTQPLPLSWAVSVLSRVFTISRNGPAPSINRLELFIDLVYKSL